METEDAIFAELAKLNEKVDKLTKIIFMVENNLKKAINPQTNKKPKQLSLLTESRYPRVEF